MPKKILYVIDRLNEGAGRVLYDLIVNLDKKKFKPIVVSFYKEGNLNHLFKNLDTEIIYLNKKKGIDFSLILKLIKILLRKKIDILHSHNADAYEYSILPAFITRINKRIHTAHGKTVKSSRYNKLREIFFHKTTSIFLDNYIAVSYDLGEYIDKNWCLDESKIEIIHNGIDVSEYNKIKVNKDFLGINKNDFIIGIVAGLRPEKDHPTLIKAMKIIQDKIPNSKLLIIGDGQEKEKIIELVRRLNLEKHILFLGNRTDVLKLYNCLDVGVLCSLTECISITLLEGMACQVPFVATNVDGNPEVIDGDINGLLVPVRDPEVLADNIIKLLKDKKLRQKLGKNARDKVLKEFQVNRMVKDYEILYEY